MSDTLKKLLMVISLTLLIWAWAFMSLAESTPFTGTLEVSPSADPSLLVTLNLPKGSPQIEISLTSLNFKGAPSRISDLSKRNNRPLSDQNRERLDFYYDPQEHEGVEGRYPLDILGYLQDSSKIHDLAVTLESCVPSQVTVTIEQLVEKELPIQCVDKDGRELKGANPVPGVVKIFVRKGYNGSATVVLTPQQIEMARKEPVEATAYVELGVAGTRRESQTPVKVELRPEEQLKELPFQPTSIGFLMSPQVASSSKVELVNKRKLTERTLFNATVEAMDAYKKMPYHILIEIRDGDELLTDIPPRPVIYNFPQEFVRSGEIELAEQLPKLAEIKIEPLNPEAN